ncbi:NAD(P)/FAD-dependent oxidoreductase [Burkholderia cepacia]|uniref:NAD(P)/FAD-dependent oxidoreductase n=1 Tax=Burkholderia cepacia TaxID=292 RepID=UPI00385775BE
MLYDTLVLSVGSVTNYFGVEGAEEFAIALDSPSDAERFRQRLIAAGTRVQHSQPAAARDDIRNVLASNAANRTARRAPVSIVIVGAGPTGVELSAELRETAETFAAYGLETDPRKDVSITIVEGGERILPALPERVSKQTRGLLDTMGVQIMTGEVSGVTAATLRTKSGKTLPSDLTVWAAGIKAPPVLAGLDNVPTNRAGHV